jgi:hypothetical protein
MYRLGQTYRRGRKVGKYLFAALLLGVIGSYVYFKHDAKNNTQITVASTNQITKEIKSADATFLVSEPLFRLTLPIGWKETGRVNKPYNYIEWRDTNESTTARSMRLYTDLIPTNLAVNRELPVKAEADRLIPGEASNNCSSFVGLNSPTPAGASNAKATEARWKDIPFLCDLPNYTREVTGTGSTGGINTVSVVGPKNGKHNYFFLYTDHTGQPEFDVLIKIVSSFVAN